MENESKSINRFSNVYLWLATGSAILNSTGLKLEDIGSWTTLFDSLLEVFSNPFQLITTAGVIVGILMNPTTKGIKD